MLLRKIESLIEDYLQSDSKKILLIDGVRQVGKPIAQSIEGKKGKTFADSYIMFFQHGLEDSEAMQF